MGPSFLFGPFVCGVMASRARWAKTWLKPEVYPIFFFIGSACAWSTYVGAKMFMENPDVSIKKRHNPIDEGFNQGNLFSSLLFSSLLFSSLLFSSLLFSSL